MAITNNMWWIILVVACGLPSAIVGFFSRRIEKKIAQAEEEKKSKDATRVKYEALMIELSVASLSLAEVTAEAVQKIPDAHCNGEMKSALSWSKEVKNKYHQFSREQTAKSVNE